MKKIKDNLFPIIIVGLGVVLIAGGLIYSLKKEATLSEIHFEKDTWNPDGTLKAGANCKTKEVEVVVPASESDIFTPGTKVKVQANYYACNKAQRGEIVMIKSPGRDEPLFKYVKMVPGDKFAVNETSEKQFQVLINGSEMTNSKNEVYTFSDRKSRMVRLYEETFKEGIKPGAYFVFGNNPRGGFDSTRFGPVTSERLVGRVLTQPPPEKQ